MADLEAGISTAAIVVLQSNDGASFELSKRAACASDFVRDSLGEEDDDDDDDDDNDNGDDNHRRTTVVDVLRVSGDCLAKVVEFLQHHDEEAMPEIHPPLVGKYFLEYCSCSTTI